MYQEAVRLYLDGKIDAAIALLDDDKLRRSAEQAGKALTDAIQGWRLKASLFTLNSDLRRLRKPMKRHCTTSIVKLIRWRAIRPGGILVLQDSDFRGCFCHPECATGFPFN
jgi:hypothetical protein